MVDAIIQTLTAMQFEGPVADQAPLNPATRPSGLFPHHYPVDKDAAPPTEIDLDVGDVCGATTSPRGDTSTAVTLWDTKKRMLIDMTRDMSMEMKRIWQTHYDNLLTDIIYGITSQDKTQWAADVQARSRANQQMRDKLRTLVPQINELLWQTYSGVVKDEKTLTQLIDAQYTAFLAYAEQTLTTVLAQFVARVLAMANRPYRNPVAFEAWVRENLFAMLYVHVARVRAALDTAVDQRAERLQAINEEYEALKGQSLDNYNARHAASVKAEHADEQTRLAARAEHAAVVGYLETTLAKYGDDNVTLADVKRALLAMAPRDPLPTRTEAYMYVMPDSGASPFQLVSGGRSTASIQFNMTSGRHYVFYANIFFNALKQSYTGRTQTCSASLNVDHVMLSAHQVPTLREYDNINLCGVPYVAKRSGSTDLTLAITGADTTMNFHNGTTLVVICF
ncbi:hypothetical protein IJGMMPBP_00037 [Infectious spleen and kidney necrosis virus]|uniref:0RF037L n=7 Tax=Infectious spleen and kidney necrosis virus TaxID=180170 RepID=Q8QUS3_ISKNN|nr:0RF037L [Infectious spleen and kidney necrosis virus]QIQ54480.1 ORF036 [Angelfish iridovirus AFIV-16]QJC63389.1 hypothetical protein [Banggai cardinalfish iridovirus]WEP24574.1 hypothetical protein ORF035L [Largemouth bass ulcerative syndrome virus]AAL98761.1 0RF037L [Infectious spleen and kidney necrosis virus]AMM04450.1 ORF044L [Infectious spleen and kidney necrosis virus]